MRLKLAARQAFTVANPDILPSSNLKKITIPNVTAFGLRFHHRHVYSITSGRFQANMTPSLTQSWAESRWSARTDPFWWSCVPRKETAHMKRTVRSYMARVVRHAVVESLRKQGLKSDGTSLDGTDGKLLFATAQFTPESSVLKTPFAEVVRQTDTALATIIKMVEAQKDRLAVPKRVYKPRRRN
ncbi:hypothetical protein LSUE1_G006026 [Lachnellula suecica]|uniref:Uncharacterized protein n=1 Tax=Lachnellula suecica TaxID=602035 RepID=A0A8T9BW64_9HELO|nr:hypothetical protein LSUE1_G006026 [Lachnellula suecica]